MNNQLFALIDESVSFLTQIDDLKADVKNNAEVAHETHGISKKDFNKHVQVAYDRAKLEQKKSEIEEAIRAYDELRNS